MYTIDTNLPHPSIPSDHLPDSTGHAFELDGIAERDNPWDINHRNYVSQQEDFSRKNSSKGKEVRDDVVRGHDEWMIKLLKYFGCPSSESSAGLLERLLYQLDQAWSQNIIEPDLSTTVDYEWVKKKSCRKKSMIGGVYFNNYRKMGLLDIETYEERRRHWQVKISPGKMLLYILQNEQLCHNAKLKKMSANLRSTLLKLPEETRPKIGRIIEQDITFLEREIIKFIFCRAWKNKSVTKNKKPFTKFFAEEKKAVSRSGSSSATPESPQYRIALKSNEAKGITEPLSETPTKLAERKDVKKETFQQKSRDRKDLKKKQPTQTPNLQASNRPQTDKAEEELNVIAEEAYEEFLILFKPEEDNRFKCFRSNFLRLIKVRVKSHLGCIKDIKTYMHKFSINQYLMGKRIQKNGKLFHPSLYGLFAPDIINDYHKGEYSLYFTPYNELDLSKQTKAVEGQDVAVPQELLEKISLALLGAGDKTEADPEQTQEIVKMIASYAVQKSEKQKLMTQTPERKPHQLNPLPVLKSSGSDQATIRVANQEKAWLKKGETYWESLDITCRQQWEDEFMDAIRRGETGFRVDQDIHDPMFRKFKTVPFMAWIGKILEQEEQREHNISSETKIEEIEPLIPDLEEPEDVEFEDFPKEGLDQSDLEGLWVTHVQHKPASYGQNMRRTLHTLLLFASLWQNAQAVEIKSCFTPQQQCLPLIVHELNNAQSEILLQTYLLTSQPIAQSLINARERGVMVKVLVKASQDKNPHSQARSLKNPGIEVMVDDKVRIAHNKVIVIDGKTLMGDSYNFSAAAEKHDAENRLIIKDDPVVQEYRQNGWNRFGKSRVLKVRGQSP